MVLVEYLTTFLLSYFFKTFWSSGPCSFSWCCVTGGKDISMVLTEWCPSLPVVSPAIEYSQHPMDHFASLIVIVIIVIIVIIFVKV